MHTILRRPGGLMILAMLAVTYNGCGAGPNENPEVGSLAPKFRLDDLNGNEVLLEQFRGKVVMLDFWAIWCGPCRVSMPLLEKLQHEFSNDMVLLAINLQEEPEYVREYVARRNIGSTVLLDIDGDVGRAYRSESIPMQVLIDKEGVIRHIQVGFHPSMEGMLREEIRKLL